MKTDEELYAARHNLCMPVIAILLHHEEKKRMAEQAPSHQMRSRAGAEWLFARAKFQLEADTLTFAADRCAVELFKRPGMAVIFDDIQHMIGWARGLAGVHYRKNDHNLSGAMYDAQCASEQ